jgi:MFS family permease
MWGAAIFWSVATSLAGLSTNLLQLIMIRALVGVGEAAYGTISPPMLSDFYPFFERNVVYGIYYLAIPIGGALGYAFGAVIGGAFGWRVAFLACGIPGIFAAIMILRLNDPMRGVNDKASEERSGSPSDTQLLPPRSSSSSANHPKNQSLQKKRLSEELLVTYREIMEILSNRYFMLATAGLVASNFALGKWIVLLAVYLHTLWCMCL